MRKECKWGQGLCLLHLLYMKFQWAPLPKKFISKALMKVL